MKEVLYEVRCLKSNEDMILALAGQCLGKQEANKLTCSQLCDFVAHLVRALHRHRRLAEVMGSNPVESPEFFRFMRPLLKFYCFKF